MNDVKRSQRRPVGQGGFTLIELLIVVAVFGVVAAMAIPLHANEEARARVAKAQADIRTSLLAVWFPAVNGRNESAGPFVTSIPHPPLGGSPAWGAYTYTSSTAGTFSIIATGDGTTVTAP